jgi:ketosteroid isomerase-like protein
MKQLVFCALIFLTSCNKPASNDIEKTKSEVLATEIAFEKMVKEQGIGAGFAFFADSDAVINRHNFLLKGKDEISKHYHAINQNVKLEWKADFVDVATSCDLAYTYGHYTFSQPDSTGQWVTSTGFFHTVWKKQSDGSWKYVWD